VANLDPSLLRALRRAATDTAGDGVEFYVISGWRSRKYQERLFREAVSKYGSKEEAARWVATSGTSAHETGNAVDLGHSDATAWLSEHGAGYGLCQIYSNETWHYELRPDAVDHGCPPMYADPTQSQPQPSRTVDSETGEIQEPPDVSAAVAKLNQEGRKKLLGKMKAKTTPSWMHDRRPQRSRF
jgi:D-alanyl-D-alanine carboxypeptidase